MTFGAMAVWQALALIGGAAAAAAGLFFIRVRPPRVAVPSLLLWRRVLDESRELTLWERIRRGVSLAVTVLIAVVLAVAITRPGRSAGSTGTAGRMLIVIDSSWSMLARTRSGETRWERALAEARRLVASASGGEVALGTTADGLVEGPTTDASLIETSLARIVPGGEDSSWPRLASTTTVHFLTDSAVTRALDPAVVVHSVFEPASNVAITALDVRPSLATGNAGDAYVEIANFSPAPQTARITLTRGSAKIFDRDVDMASSELLRQVVPLVRAGDPALRARVSARDNALEADDEAYAWIGGATTISVTVVGRDTDWLAAAFSRDPGVRATFVDPTSYAAADEDVTIFVGWAPPEPPGRPALLFAPPLSTPWLGGLRGGIVENGPHWEVPGSHPVVMGVDPFTLSIERARTYSAPALVPVARSARNTPLVSISESPERRLVVVSFGADESNLASAPGFPVLMGNALEWLTQPASALALNHRPRLASFDPGIARVTGPDGADVPLSRVNRTGVAMLRAPGFYTVHGGGARSTVAINAGDPQLSNLTRSPSTVGEQPRTVKAGASTYPWWVYCAIAAFVLILAEWWTWQRRITV